jgi:soluble lytic murein transglycosylase-like protein
LFFAIAADSKGVPRLMISFCMFGLAVRAAENAQADAVRSAMDAAIRMQRASIVRQAQSVAVQAEIAVPVNRADSGESFFLIPWPKPVGMPAATADCDPLPRGQVDRLATDAARNEDVSVDLVRSVMEQESGFRPCAVSARGAQGLMQLMPATAADLRVSDPFDPQQNVTAGARYLKQLLEKYGGDVGRALAAYNAGPARVDRTRGLPPIPETQTYISGVLSRLAVD